MNALHVGDLFHLPLSIKILTLIYHPGLARMHLLQNSIQCLRLHCWRSYHTPHSSSPTLWIENFSFS